jgi:hypothetical protein
VSFYLIAHGDLVGATSPLHLLVRGFSPRYGESGHRAGRLILATQAGPTPTA